MFAAPPLGKRPPTKVAKLEIIKTFSPSYKHVKGILSKRTMMKVDLLKGPSSILFAGVHVSTFQPGNFTGWGSEGVKFKL